LIDRLREFGLEDGDPSTIYRALRDMEERGWIASNWEQEETQGPPRRIYRLTPSGDEVLAGWTEDLRETRSLIDDLLEIYARHMAEEGEGHDH
jgi:PadR family transcriptional regulator, regulatory protein PadR